MLNIKNNIFKNLSNSLFGTILLIGPYFFFTIMELTAKELGENFNPFQVVFARYSSQLILLVFLFNQNSLKILDGTWSVKTMVFACTYIRKYNVFVIKNEFI